MTYRQAPILLLLLAAVLLAPATAYAQDVRSEGLFYVQPKFGISSYFGDNEKSPFNFNGDAFDEGASSPFTFGAEIGYQLKPTYVVGLGFTYGNYPLINQFVHMANTEDDPTRRTSIELLARHVYGGATNKLGFYVQAGVHATFGETKIFPDNATLAQLNSNTLDRESKVSFGPLLGFGLSYAFTPRAALLVGWNSHITFPDNAVDGRDNDNEIPNQTEAGFGPADFLNQITIGLKLNIGRKPVPVEVLSLDGPTTLIAGEAGMYTGMCNDDATQPVTYALDFGDGTVLADPSGSHTYSQAGTYTVTLRCTNKVNTDARSMTVRVLPACEAAAITSMTASNMSPDTRTAVNFSANVTGSQPITYRWDFGDGTTATGANPSHTYARAGSYTVTLTATQTSESCANRTTTRTMQITVARYEVPFCQTITEMNSVFFGRNSSTLTAEARERLQENLAIFNQCPCVTAQLHGYAAPGERSPDRLSADRARAVEQFYLDNGVAASRLMTEGRGRVGGTTSKKEGTSQFRRVDTIPSTTNCGN